MFKSLIQNYRPKIQFRVGMKNALQVENQPIQAPVEIYEKPSYLLFKKKLTEDECEMLNQGGRSPAIPWKKIAPITDII